MICHSNNIHIFDEIDLYQLNSNRPLLIIIFVLYCIVTTIAQSPTKIVYDSAFYLAHKINTPIKLDGVIDEPIWQSAQKASNFHQNSPYDSLPATGRSEVMVTYDDKYIYVGAKVYNTIKNQPYITPSLKRDYRGESNDALVIELDTYNDRNNAYSFGINPFGVLREGLVSNGGMMSEDLNLAWENKWNGQSKIYEDYWTLEMAIPLTSLRFNNGAKQWLVNFYRIDSYNAEKSGWAKIPNQYSLTSLAFSKPLQFEIPIQKKGANISIIPYTSPNFQKTIVDGKIVMKNSVANGADIKVGIGSSLNLDLTINPDFSQIEVDNQVTNLDRFEIFFPEKRQFFLENGDLFSSFGMEGIRPFFSRRIGVSYDSSTKLNIPTNINGGLRLSGKLNDKLRLGLMHMQTAENSMINEPPTAYSVLTLQQKVFTRSNFGVMLVNKQPSASSQFNRVLGLDYNLASKENKWNGKIFYQKSIEDFKTKHDQAFGSSLIYNIRSFDTKNEFSVVEDNFNPEVGFVKRKGYQRISNTTNWKFYLTNKKIVRHGPGIDYDFIQKPGKGLTDYDLNLLYSVHFRNSMLLFVKFRKDYTLLLSDFDPTRTNGLKLKANQSFHYNSVSVTLNTDYRKKLAAKLSSKFGEYLNGQRFNIEGELSYRVQPIGLGGFIFSYNKLNFPSPYKSAELILLGPKFDITFSKKLFFSSLLQYNNQINNVNVNTRIQWRFAPASDLFIVYTDNYYADSYLSKGGAIVLKATYWFNL